MEESERPYLVLVGRRVRAARILAGLTQDELAARAAMSRVTLGTIERGDHAATLLTYLKASRALRLAAVLDVSLLELVDVDVPAADRVEGLPS